jgi:hypothetical protein
MYFYF